MTEFIFLGGQRFGPKWLKSLEEGNGTKKLENKVLT